MTVLNGTTVIGRGAGAERLSTYTKTCMTELSLPIPGPEGRLNVSRKLNAIAVTLSNRSRRRLRTREFMSKSSRRISR
jgi:hypothetical protein